MACSGRGSYGQGDGQLEIELGSNGGSKEEEEIREEEENRGGEWIGEALGSLSPSSPARGGGKAGTQVLPGRRGRRPPPAAYWRAGGDERGRWAGPG